MHIVFLSLFLGLVSGPQQIELSLSGPPAAAVELLLDGAPAGRLAGPPWRGRVDLGPGLLPHRLTARALDAQGGELARADQWLNLAHPPVSFEILLEGGDGRAPRVARVVWQSLDNRPPKEIALAFDMRGASERLLRELDEQRVVWLEGLHLPQTVALTPAARGVELVSGAH